VSLDPAGTVIALQVHNLDEVATLRIPNQTNNLPGQLVVPFDILSKIIKGCPAEQSVRFIASKAETKIRYRLAGSEVDRVVSHFPPAEWPEVKTITQEPIALDDAFKQAIREALESSSTDAGRYVLNGACLDVSDKEAHYVVGTDGRHLYSANSFRFDIPETLIVPTRKFVSWPAFANDGPWKLRMLPAVRVDPQDKKADKS
jgi:DNA polymerase III sliding clamp (beta) subunit (PCNA family)